MTDTVLVVCSGGMDSVTLAHQVAQSPNHRLLGLISFDYGQIHKKELNYAKQCAKKLRVSWQLIPIPDLGECLKSALTGDSNIPQGAYNKDNMTATVVPNRNPIMLSIAYGVGSSMGAEYIGIAVHGGDHFVYPDCRPAFLQAFDTMQRLALDGLHTPKLYAPYTHITKTDIARIAKGLNLDMVQSWSCYQGRQHHCGKCGTCIERLQAVKDSGVMDTTIYTDTSFIPRI